MINRFNFYDVYGYFLPGLMFLIMLGLPIGTKQKRKLEEAVVAMLTQRNIEEAARSVGISTATLMRWQKLPEFQTAYREARRAAFGQAVARLQQGTAAAAGQGRIRNREKYPAAPFRPLHLSPAAQAQPVLISGMPFRSDYG